MWDLKHSLKRVFTIVNKFVIWFYKVSARISEKERKGRVNWRKLGHPIHIHLHQHWLPRQRKWEYWVSLLECTERTPLRFCTIWGHGVGQTQYQSHIGAGSTHHWPRSVEWTRFLSLYPSQVLIRDKIRTRWKWACPFSLRLSLSLPIQWMRIVVSVIVVPLERILLAIEILILL
jgi:hypothetical protein